MMRGRIPRLRLFIPRFASPLLPVSRPRLPPHPRIPSFRLAHSPTSPALPPRPSLSQRLRHLIKSYGWYALGVYGVLCVLDFTVAFAGINLLGADYVASLAASAKAAVGAILHVKPPEPGLDELETPPSGAAGGEGHEGLYAMLVLAYTIHKTVFLPFRVGLTAAFTPRLVTWLKARGWAGGEGARHVASEMRAKIKGKDPRDAGS